MLVIFVATVAWFAARKQIRGNERSPFLVSRVYSVA